MLIEHSTLMNEFISFWFETRVDGVVTYETFVDFRRLEWYTCRAGEDGPIRLRGNLDASLSEDAMVEQVKPVVEAAVSCGRI